MTAGALTLRGRAAAQALMVDGCVITRGSSEAVFDEDSGRYTTTAGATLYQGPCRVRPRDNSDQVVDAAGGQNVSLLAYVVSVPVDGIQYEVDDLVTVTSSTLDPTLAGLLLRVRQTIAGTHLTARRLGCEVDAG